MIGGQPLVPEQLSLEIRRRAGPDSLSHWYHCHRVTVLGRAAARGAVSQLVSGKSVARAAAFKLQFMITVTVLSPGPSQRPSHSLIRLPG